MFTHTTIVWVLSITQRQKRWKVCLQLIIATSWQWKHWLQYPHGLMMTKVFAPSSYIGFVGCMMGIGQKYILDFFLYHATNSKWFFLLQPIFHLLAKALPTIFQLFPIPHSPPWIKPHIGKPLVTYMLLLF